MHDSTLLAPICKGEIDGVTKLFPSFYPQTGYVVSLPLLARYVRLGVRITKVHRIWKLNMKPYFRDYMLRMGRIRAEATSESVKAQAKLCSVAPYGCTLENKKNRRTLVMHTDEYRWELDVAKNCKKGTRAWVHYMQDGLFIGLRERFPTKGVCLDTPRLTGFWILDLAKCRMFDCVHVLKRICPTTPRLLYTDTDSLIVHFPNERDIGEIMKRAPDLFDYKAGKFLGWEQTGREGQLGLFKNEKVGKVEHNGEMVDAEERIVQYAGSDSKTYATEDHRYIGAERIFAGKFNPAKCKGVPKYALDKKAIFEQIRKAALESTVQRAKFNTIRMKGTVAEHKVVQKVAFRGNNNKVGWLEDNTCLPLGHYRCA
jgi:hypothetical protein